MRRPPPALVGSESRGVAPDCPQGFAVGCHVLESALAGSSHVAGFSTIRPLAASGSVVGTTPLAGPHVRIGCSQPLQRLILGMCAHLEAPRGGRCFPCGRVRGVRVSRLSRYRGVGGDRCWACQAAATRSGDPSAEGSPTADGSTPRTPRDQGWEWPGGAPHPRPTYAQGRARSSFSVSTARIIGTVYPVTFAMPPTRRSRRHHATCRAALRAASCSLRSPPSPRRSHRRWHGRAIRRRCGRATQASICTRHAVSVRQRMVPG